MDRQEIQNLIKDLIEKTTIKLDEISLAEDKPGNLWISAQVGEPHFFISGNGEGLHALNHLVHRILETGAMKKKKKEDSPAEEPEGLGVIVDINGFQKKHVDNIRAIAHMMSERARYFKSNIEVDPMSAFERRIIHEFLSDAADLETESIGTGRDRRVVIKYVGNL